MTDINTGSAPVQGPLWSARAQDWAEVQEHVARPSWQAVIDEHAPLAGQDVLDIGCGSGGFAVLADAAGARVAGIDAAPGMVEIAEHRVPAAAFRVGELERLPYADGSYDLVTGFNSFQYAVNPVNALREAKRVTGRGGGVVVMVWGTADECEPAAYLRALAALLPPPPPGAPSPFALSGPDGLERLVADAGLVPGPRRIVDCPWEYPDQPTLVRGLLSSGPAARAIAHAGEAAAREAVTDASAPYRRADGSYHMRCTFHHLSCTV